MLIQLFVDAPRSTRHGDTPSQDTNMRDTTSLGSAAPESSEQQHRSLTGQPRVLQDRDWGIDKLLDWKRRNGETSYLVHWSSADLDKHYIQSAPDLQDYVMVGALKCEIEKKVEIPEDRSIFRVDWKDTWESQGSIGQSTQLISDLECCRRSRYKMGSAATDDLLESIRKRPYAERKAGKDIYKAVRKRMKEQLTKKMWQVKDLLALSQARAVLPHGVYFDKGLSTTKRWILNMKNLRAVLVQATGALQAEPCNECRKGSGVFIGCVVDRQPNGISRGACASCYYADKSKRCSLHQDSKFPVL